MIHNESEPSLNFIKRVKEDYKKMQGVTTLIERDADATIELEEMVKRMRHAIHLSETGVSERVVVSERIRTNEQEKGVTEQFTIDLSDERGEMRYLRTCLDIALNLYTSRNRIRRGSTFVDCLYKTG